MLLLLSWPPVRVVCPNYEVVMFQPWTVTPPYVGYVVNCYVATSFFLTRSALLLPTTDFPLGELPAPDPGHSSVYFRCANTQDNSPTWASPVSVPSYQYPLIPAQSSYSSASLSPHPLSPRLPYF